MIPKDGVIYNPKEVLFQEGETVFDVLLRETRANQIHMEFSSLPTCYVKGIQNLYEFDCGKQSGWLYQVNGKIPNHGSHQYHLSKGDKIEWIYTCTGGKS